MTTADSHAADAAHAHDGAHDHGHVIVPWQALLGVLLVLLVLTVATVFTAQAEIFVTGEWGWELPGWLNIVVAMSIALVKGTLVALYFMQLRYDKGINALIMLFTLFAVTLFLLFTMLDLGNRNTITEWRAGEVNPGGTTLGSGIVATARANYIAEMGLTEEEYWKKWDEKHAGHGHGGGHGAASGDVSTANHSVKGAGLTPGLFATGVWAEHDEHHDEHHDANHADGKHADGKHGDGDHDDGGH
ncbi:MAG: cytochrome C oxidase subunit IV family protein [Planctomycetota bacterium]